MLSVEPMKHIMFQTTGDFITESIFFSYFHLCHKTEIQVFRYVTPWILARYHEKYNNIS